MFETCFHVLKLFMNVIFIFWTQAHRGLTRCPVCGKSFSKVANMRVSLEKNFNFWDEMIDFWDEMNNFMDEMINFMVLIV